MCIPTLKGSLTPGGWGWGGGGGGGGGAGSRILLFLRPSQPDIPVAAIYLSEMEASARPYHSMT